MVVKDRILNTRLIGLATIRGDLHLKTVLMGNRMQYGKLPKKKNKEIHFVTLWKWIIYTLIIISFRQFLQTFSVFNSGSKFSGLHVASLIIFNNKQCFTLQCLDTDKAQTTRSVIIQRPPVFPLKLSIPMGESGPPSNTWLLRPTQVLSQNGIPIHSTVFAQLAADCTHTLQWASPCPHQHCPFSWGIWPPSTTWFLAPTTRVLNQNSTSIGSVIFPRLTTVSDRPTDRPRYSVCNSRLHLYGVCSTAMWPKNEHTLFWHAHHSMAFATATICRRANTGSHRLVPCAGMPLYTAWAPTMSVLQETRVGIWRSSLHSDMYSSDIGETIWKCIYARRWRMTMTKYHCKDEHLKISSAAIRLSHKRLYTFWD